MIELSCPVVLDGDPRGCGGLGGIIVGRGFDFRRQSMIYDVRFSIDSILLGVIPERLRITGPCRRDVIGRDIPHNPKRAHLFESEIKLKAA